MIQIVYFKKKLNNRTQMHFKLDILGRPRTLFSFLINTIFNVYFMYPSGVNYSCQIALCWLVFLWLIIQMPPWQNRKLPIRSSFAPN